MNVKLFILVDQILYNNIALMMRLILIWANVTSLTGDFTAKEKVSVSSLRCESAAVIFLNPYF